MNFEVKIDIKAPKETVWKVITDIDNSASNISGIDEVEILERPTEGFVGLKWKETRTLFGKTAIEVMWITESEENEYYKTRAESHGAIYKTVLNLVESENGTELTMNFIGEAQTFGAKIMSAVTGIFFKKATLDALKVDLEDIKAASEINN